MVDNLVAHHAQPTISITSIDPFPHPAGPHRESQQSHRLEIKLRLASWASEPIHSAMQRDLLVFAEEEVVSAVGHERLLTHIG